MPHIVDARLAPPLALDPQAVALLLSALFFLFVALAPRKVLLFLTALFAVVALAAQVMHDIAGLLVPEAHAALTLSLSPNALIPFKLCIVLIGVVALFARLKRPLLMIAVIAQAMLAYYEIALLSEILASDSVARALVILAQ